MNMTGMIESDNLIIRRYNEDDFEDFVRLQKEDPILRSFDEDIIRNSTRKVLEESSCERYSIFEKTSMQYCGNIEFHQDAAEEYPEIGITLLEEKQNQGIGTEALVSFCNDCVNVRGISTILIRIEQENVRSRHLFEKLGAECIGNKTLPIFEKIYREMGKSVPSNSDEIGAATYYLKLPIRLAE